MSAFGHVHRYTFELTFPHGVHCGEGQDSNTLHLARDGSGSPVLRGTTIAGILRSSMRLDSAAMDAIFGSQHESETLTRSLLDVGDARIEIGAGAVQSRTHNLIDRHTGAPVSGGLFTLDVCPPGSIARICLWLRAAGESTECQQALVSDFETKLGGALEDPSLTFGGNSNRGVGTVRSTKVRRKTYTLSDPDGAGCYLDDHRAWREGQWPTDGEELEPQTSDDASTLRITLRLRIPRGQDLLIGDPSGGSTIRPQRVLDTEGKEYWSLPGSALRGALRKWVARNAVIAGLPVADSVDRHDARVESGMEACGEDLGWEFLDESDRRRIIESKGTSASSCVVSGLFGSLIRAGRIHISDSRIPIDAATRQPRMHVAIDRVSGGANEGQLFEAPVLTPGANANDDIFEPTIIIQHVDEEADSAILECLADSIRALDIGCIRIGSSKSSGRLELESTPDASGPLSDLFKAIEPHQWSISNDPVVEGRPTPAPVPPQEDDETRFQEATQDQDAVSAFLKSIPKLPGKLRQTIQTDFRTALTRQDISGVRDSIDAARRFRKRVNREYDKRADQDTARQKTDDWIEAVESILPREHRPGPFYNPYTFIPFLDRPVRDRHAPTPLTAEEQDGSRHTGVLTLGIRTISPVMSVEALAADGTGDSSHPVFNALTIGDDAIVPATSVRGSLRTLLTILTSGTLGYIDEDLVLCQGRDVNLEASPNRSCPEEGLFLARVIEVGTSQQPGRIRTGDTRLVKASALQKLWKGPLPRPKARKSDDGEPVDDPPVQELWARLKVDDDGEFVRDEKGNVIPDSLSPSSNRSHQWQVKLSGKPIGDDTEKREAVFRAGDSTISVGHDQWKQYENRHRRADHKRLQIGDLVWIELHDGSTRLESETDIRTMQWARLGRRGKPIADLVGNLGPDSRNSDGLVDEITNLFGQVGFEKETPGARRPPTFASRVRPENLVFHGARSHLAVAQPLPALMSPNPGCLAFYRDQDDPGRLSRDDPLRGYKVYRAAHIAESDDLPWQYSTQGIYTNKAILDPENDKNRSAQLIPASTEGTLRIAFRSLSDRELSLLLLACHLPWRLGGGKPLGLGCVRTQVIDVIDHLGEPKELPENWRVEVEDVADRVDMWLASQRPVPNLRYPRAVDASQIGGHVWFKRHAEPKFAKSNRTARNEPPEVKGLVERNGQKGQLLPKLDPDHPETGQMWGYDLDPELRPVDVPKQ